MSTGSQSWMMLTLWCCFNNKIWCSSNNDFFGPCWMGVAANNNSPNPGEIIFDVVLIQMRCHQEVNLEWCCHCDAVLTRRSDALPTMSFLVRWCWMGIAATNSPNSGEIIFDGVLIQMRCHQEVNLVWCCDGVSTSRSDALPTMSFLVCWCWIGGCCHKKPKLWRNHFWCCLDSDEMLSGSQSCMMLMLWCCDAVLISRYDVLPTMSFLVCWCWMGVTATNSPNSAEMIFYVVLIQMRCHQDLNLVWC